MRYHIHVQRKLAKLRDNHGLNDAQLLAVCPFVVAAELQRPVTYVTPRRYEVWYKPK